MYDFSIFSLTEVYKLIPNVSLSSSELNTASALTSASWFYKIWILEKKFLKDQVFENRPFPGYFWTLSHLAVPNVLITDYLEYIKILLEKTLYYPREVETVISTASASVTGF